MNAKNKSKVSTVISFVLVVLLVLASIPSLAFSSLAEQQSDSTANLAVFEDDFNRTDGSIDGDNGWVSVYNSTYHHEIVNNYLSVRDYSNQNGIATCFTKRPTSESSVMQRVSVDLLNPNGFTFASSANVHLRYVADSSSTGPAKSYYVAITKQSIKIGKVCGTWSDSSATKPLTSGGEETFYVHNPDNVYRIEFSAEGTSPTILTATLFDKTAGVAVATVSGSDSEADLQNAGTVALSTKKNGAGQDTAQFDNFKYEYQGSSSDSSNYITLCDDSFTRTDGTVGNNWSFGDSTKGSVEISDNAVLLKRTNPTPGQTIDSGYVSELSMVRPRSEISLNQIVSAEFTEATQGNKPDQGGVVIARCQGNKATATNCYRFYVRLGNGGGTTTTGLYLYNTTSTPIFSMAYARDMSRNTKYRLELKVESVSSNESKLTASMIIINNDGSETVTFSREFTDSDSNLQKAGTAGFSEFTIYGHTMKVDNFKYQYQPVFADDFNRADGAVGNGWTQGDTTKANVTISDNQVYMARTNPNRGMSDSTGSLTQLSMVRPQSEKTLNQIVSAVFKCPEDNKQYQGGVLIARCQGDKFATNNCYRFEVRLGNSDVANSTTVGVYLYNSKGEAIWSVPTARTLAANSRYRLELIVESVSSTKTHLIASMYVINNDGTETALLDHKADGYDEDPNLQKAGTVGFTQYTRSGHYMNVDNFRYQELISSDKQSSSTDVFFDKDTTIFKTFEAEAVETYRYNYSKSNSVENASDGYAAIQNTQVATVSYDNLTDELLSNSAYIIYNINANTTGNYPVKLRYKYSCTNKSDFDMCVSSNNKPYATIIVNDVKYKIYTDTYNAFSTSETYEIPLNSGVNTIYCMAPTSELLSVLPGSKIDYDCLLISGDAKTSAGNYIMRGDLNDDDEVNIIDLVKMKKYLAYSSADIQKEAANFDESNDVLDSNDVTKMIKFILGALPSNEMKEETWPKFVETDYPTIDEMLNNTYYKLETNKKLNVGFLGGSVSVGQRASTTGGTPSTKAWRTLTYNWLCEEFPQAEINQINGTLGGTGSSYGLQNVTEKLKLNNDEEKPDLVFIEYAINDYYNGENSTSVKNNMEWIIRTIYSACPDADIVIVLTGEYTNLNLDYETKMAHKWIAERFRLPCISVAEKLWADMVEENNGNNPSNKQWLKYFAQEGSSTFDWVHPNDAGYEKYAEYVTDYLNEIFKAKSSVPAKTNASFLPLAKCVEKEGKIPLKNGNYEFFDNAYYKLTKTKKLNVAYFGGSISFGLGASNTSTTSWRALTTKWLKDNYPNATITENNAAIGGTGTAYGIYRAVSHLKLEDSNARPDLLFIEFAINDVYDGTDYTTAKANLEQIIRTVYEYSPQTEIVVLLTTDGVQQASEYGAYRAHKEVAEKFNLPCIAIGKLLWEEQGVNGNWGNYFLTDGVHPNDAGHAKYSSYITSYLDEVLSSKNSVLANPKTFDVSNVEIGANLPGKAWLQTFSGQSAPASTEIFDSGINKGIMRTVGSPASTSFEVEFTGTDFSFWIYKTTTSGDITVSVDGGPSSVISLYNNTDLYQIVPIASGLSNGNHTISVSFAQSSHGSYMQINGCYFKANVNNPIILTHD